MASELIPDIVLMDISMPIRDGVEASRLIAAQNPQVGVIILTMYGETKHVIEALKAGARGYILKSVRAKELIEAIRAVHQGRAVLEPGVTNILLKEFRRLADDSQEAPPVGLSKREAEILRLVAQGKSNKDIADLLSLSEQTIKNRLSAVYHKLKVANRAEAVTYAIQQGLISLE
jgi:DNA-binding NarL/FixJ family response regulator